MLNNSLLYPIGNYMSNRQLGFHWTTRRLSCYNSR